MRKVGEALDATDEHREVWLFWARPPKAFFGALIDGGDVGMGGEAGQIDVGQFTTLISREIRRMALHRARQGPGWYLLRAQSDFLTVSKTWGLTFRVDFTIGDQPNGDLLNRLVCWRRKNGQIGTVYAMGQAMTPLPS